MRSLLLLSVAALAGTGCETVPGWLQAKEPPIGPRVTGDQLCPTLSGNSLVTREDQVPPLVIYFGEDGDLHGLRANNYRDTGTWSVDNDTVCGEWDNWYGTMSRCWEVYRSGNRLTFKRPDSGTVVAATLTPGDVGGLK